MEMQTTQIDKDGIHAKEGLVTVAIVVLFKNTIIPCCFNQPMAFTLLEMDHCFSQEHINDKRMMANEWLVYVRREEFFTFDAAFIPTNIAKMFNDAPKQSSVSFAMKSKNIKKKQDKHKSSAECEQLNSSHTPEERCL